MGANIGQEYARHDKGTRKENVFKVWYGNKERRRI